MADDATIDRLASNIAGIESAGSGDYNALGVVIPKSGDRAYGKYQIMGENVPKWTKEATGVEVTPDQFLADPDLQERTARYKMAQYYDQFGNDEDVASMWHAGVPYEQAVREGRKDPLGTKTADYGKRVAAGGAPKPQPTIVVLPDGREVDLGVNPTPELIEQVKTKIRADFPDLGAAPSPQPAAVGDTAPIAPPAAPPPPTTPKPAESPQLSVEKPWRGLSVDEAAAEMNTAVGLSPDSALGQYGASVGKPLTDALSDVYNAFFQSAPAGGDPTKLATWGDALDRSLKLLHPLGVPAEIAGNLAFQALTDAGAPPEVSGALATLTSLGVGAKTPVPGLDVTPGPRMPLQGTRATRAAAAEAETAATQAEAAVPIAQTASDDLATRADELAAEADAAAQTASPSPTARARAQAELNPGDTAPTAGSAAVTGQLQRELDEVRNPVKGIYDAVLDKAEAEHRSLDPSTYQGLSEQVAALKEDLGATLTGQPAQVIDEIEQAINTGSRLSYRQLDAYKQQLDTLFPGRVPRGATPRQRALYDYKWDVRDRMRSMVDDEDRKWLEAADALWRDVIVGKDNPQALGNLVQLARKNPQTFVERVFGAGTADKQGVYAQAVMRHLPDATKTQLREATLARAIDAATDTTTGNLDPARLLQTVGRYNENFAEAMLPPNVRQFFTLLQREQAAVGETALAARAGAREAGAAARAVGTAERAAGAARRTADQATRAAQEPNRIARMTALGLEIGGTAAVHTAFGPVAGAAAAGAAGARRALQLFIPRASLARALADSPTANLLVRAIKTPFNSRITPTIITMIRNRGTSVGYLGEPAKEQEQP